MSLETSILLGKVGNIGAAVVATRCAASCFGTVRDARCIVGTQTAQKGQRHKGMARKTKPPLNFRRPPAGM